MATPEERLDDLESRVDQLEVVNESAVTIDSALLRRVDAFGSNLRRLERTVTRGFAEQGREIKELQLRVEHVEKNIEVLVEAARDHKAAIETLAGQLAAQGGLLLKLEAGQEQIISFLTGNNPTHD